MGERGVSFWISYHVGVTSADGKPVTQTEPFCLLSDLEGQSQDLQHVAVVEASGR